MARQPILRAALIPGVLLAASLAAPRVAMPWDARMEGLRPLRYVTLNIFHGGVLSELTQRDQHLEARLDLVASALRALEPDVVALQEASIGRRRGDVASRLAAQLGLPHVLSVPPSFRFHDWAWVSRWVAAFLDLSEGPAILSRFPIALREIHRLPRCNGWKDSRVLVLAEIVTPWGPSPAYSVHTSGAECQARYVADLVRSRQGPLPAVVMGDFNAIEDSPGILSLTNGGSLRDVFRLVNPVDPGPTVWQPVTAAERRARRRVDYVFLAPGLDFAGEVLGSRVVLDTPGRLADGTPLWPSDHYGVLADLVLSPSGSARVGPSATRATIQGP